MTCAPVAPFSKGGAPTGAGIWRPIAGPKVCEANFGFSRAEPWKKRRSRPISRVLSGTVIPLGASSPIRSSSLPGDTAGHSIVSLFGLAPGGVCRAGPLPDSRCALTAPFHPCLIPEGPSAVSFCCTFRRLAPPRRYLAPCPVEPGLSSARLRATRLSRRLRRGALSLSRPSRGVLRCSTVARVPGRRRQGPPHKAFTDSEISQSETIQQLVDKS